MLNLKKHIILVLIALVSLTGLVSCEREMGPLEPAPFPADAEVFIDGFGPSIEPHSFLGTKLDALQTTEEETYAGELAIEITVPAPGDASGATWSGGALVASLARDLTGYNALSFWVKANKALTLDVVGIGNDNEPPNPYVAERVGIEVTTSWAQHIIPIPLSDKLDQEMGMFYYSESQENGEGATIWLDEIKFENNGLIAYPSVNFAETSVDVYETSEVSIPAVTVTFDVNGSPVDVLASPLYLTYSSSADSVVTVNADGTLSATGQGTAVIHAMLGDVAVEDSLTVTVAAAPPRPDVAAPTPTVDSDSVKALFSDVYTAETTANWYTYWEGSNAEVDEITVDGDNVFQFLKLDFAGIDFTETPMDVSDMTHFHVDVWTPDNVAAPAAFKILLVDLGADGTIGTGDDRSHELSFNDASTPALTDSSWSSLDIPLSDFAGLTTRSNLGQFVISGDPNTVYLDNVYFYNSGEVIEVPDDGGPSVAAPVPTVDADSVMSLYSDAYTSATAPNFYTYWEGSSATVVEQSIGGDSLFLFTDLNFAGIDFASGIIDISEMNRFHIDFWTPNSVTGAELKVKLVDFGANESYDGGDDSDHELTFTTSTTPALASGSWVAIDVPLSSFTGLTSRDNLAQAVLSASNLDSVYVDNIYFYNSGEVIEVPDDGGPSEAAPVPTVDADSVMSLYSDAYDGATTPNFYTYWTGSNAQVMEIAVSGDSLFRFTDLNFAGIDFATNLIDISAMTHFHIDFWTSATLTGSEFKVKLVDFGANESYDGGDDSDHELTFTSSTTPALASDEWVGIDVPLSEFSGLTNRDNLAQLVLSAVNLDTIYVDNIYFYIESASGEPATEPTTAAPAPSWDTADVISLFCNAYTNVNVTTWSPDWDQADVSDIQIGSDDVKVYSITGYALAEFSTPTVDGSSMTHFHFNLWTPDETAAPTAFKVKLVDFGADGAYDGDDDVEHELTYTASSTPALSTGQWITFDIPLSDFAGLTSQAHLAQLIFSGDLETLYLDNILLHR